MLPRGGGHDTFVRALAITVALLALIFTLGWVVYHRLTVEQSLSPQNFLDHSASQSSAPHARPGLLRAPP